MAQQMSSLTAVCILEVSDHLQPPVSTTTTLKILNIAFHLPSSSVPTGNNHQDGLTPH